MERPHQRGWIREILPTTRTFHLDMGRNKREIRWSLNDNRVNKDSLQSLGWNLLDKLKVWHHHLPLGGRICAFNMKVKQFDWYQECIRGGGCLKKMKILLPQYLIDG